MASPQAPTGPPPTPAEAAMTQALASDRPTIDSAIKSYISLVCAKTLTASATDSTSGPDGVKLLGILKENPSDTTSPQQQVLAFARIILSTVNAYNFPIHQTVASTMAAKPGTTPEKEEQLLELSIVARIWNGLVQSQQKPSKYLGRRALKLAWKNNNNDKNNGLELESKMNGDAQKLLWLREFERLLFFNDQQQDTTTTTNNNQDNDAALLWAADGGQEELAKRQKRRQQAATLRKAASPEAAAAAAATTTTTTPMIEELDESSS